MKYPPWVHWDCTWICVSMDTYQPWPWDFKQDESWVGDSVDRAIACLQTKQRSPIILPQWTGRLAGSCRQALPQMAGAQGGMACCFWWAVHIQKLNIWSCHVAPPFGQLCTSLSQMHPNNCELNSMNHSSVRETYIRTLSHSHIPAHTYNFFLSAHMGGPTATFIRLLKSYEYAVGIKAGADLSNCPYFIKME